VEEVKKLLRLLQNEKEEKKPFALFFILAAFIGCRKGELLGAEWKDFYFNSNTFSIRRGYYYNTVERIYFTDTSKTKTSRRCLKLPAHVMETL
jgi:integrase